MRISVKEIYTTGFAGWSEARPPQTDGDSDEGEGDGAVTLDPHPEESMMMPPEQPHRPWLVPGWGTL